MTRLGRTWFFAAPAALVVTAIVTSLVVQQVVGPAQGSGFFESFDGAPGAPAPWSSPRWMQINTGEDGLITTHFGGVEGTTHEPIRGGHGPACQAPYGNSDVSLNIHEVPQRPPPSASYAERENYEKNVKQGYLYTCANHMMSMMNDGTSQISFLPRYDLNWAGRTQTIEFDVNPFSTERMWWELYVVPLDDLTLATSILSRQAVTFGLQSDTIRVKEIANYRPVDWGGGRYHASSFDGYCSSTFDPACETDLRIRRHVKIAFNTTTFNVSITKPDNSLYTYAGTFPQPLGFTHGVAMMSHWSYNPTKDGPFTTGGQTRPLSYGNPVSLFTYHWENFQFDGPATPLKTGYVPQPFYVDTAKRNPSDVLHVQVTSADLRNPQIWGLLDDAGHCGTDFCDAPSRTDSNDTSHWAQVSINGGAWLDLPSIRAPGSPFVSEDNALNLSTSHTFRQFLPAGALVVGDNTVQFRAGSSGSGFVVNFFEIQVDPNADLPPAGGTALPPTSTPIPGATQTAIPTVSGQTGSTVTFNDLTNPNRALNGAYPAGVIDWGTNAWYLSGPWNAFATNSIGFNGPTINQGTLTFTTPKRLVSLRAYNGSGPAASISLTCPGSPSITQAVAAGQILTINTGWLTTCASVTVSTTNGWHTNLDDLVIDSGPAPVTATVGATNVSTASPVPTTGVPTATPAVQSTATPTATLVPTATAAPSATGIPSPTRTSTAIPTMTPVPTPLPGTPTLTPVPCFSGILRDHEIPPYVVQYGAQVPCP